MADIPSIIKKIQIEETDYLSVIDEATIQKIGGVINYIIDNYVIPTGTVIPFAGDETALGVWSNAWLPCDGRAISRTTYSNLFNVIGTRYGIGDGSTTFNIPDLRGLFIRGVDKSSITGVSGRDPDSSSRTPSGSGGVSGNNVGSYQGDQFKSHSHHWSGIGGYGPILSHYFPANNFDSYSLETSSVGGSETRPKNISMLYIIKI